MVESQLVARGIADRRVLAAMASIPREWFVPRAVARRAYDDAALATQRDQTISQPYMVARMTELLAARPGDRVLEIGTGSGYQTAILATLEARVFTIEWHLSLLLDAWARFERMRLRGITARCGDGSRGWAAAAPFQGVIVTAGAPDIPEPLADQLADGGRLLAPVGPLDDQELVLLERRGSSFERTRIMRCRFVPLVGERGWRL